MCLVELVIYGPSVSSTPHPGRLSPSECTGLPAGPGLALVGLGAGLRGSLAAFLLQAALQLVADAVFAAVQSLQEQVCLLLQLVQFILVAAVQPDELFGSESDVQQAGFAQNIVRVAEALPLYVNTAVVEIRLQFYVLLGSPPGNRETPTLRDRGSAGRWGAGRLCLVHG